jgi:hypothetical protein
MKVMFDRRALHDGNACCLVDNELWVGFDALDLTIHSHERHAWMESEHITAGGAVMVPNIRKTELVERNYLPAEVCTRLADDPSLIVVGLNRHLLAAGGKAVTAYNQNFHIQARSLRIEGFCHSVVVVPPLHKSLDAWVETHGKVFVQ